MYTQQGGEYVSERKNVSFKNGRVLKAIAEQPDRERSDFIERCILYYLDVEEQGYATKADIEKHEKMINDLSKDYLRVINIVDKIISEMVKNRGTENEV